MDYKSTKGNNYQVGDNIDGHIDKSKLANKLRRYDRNQLFAIDSATHRTRLNGEIVTKVRKL